MALTSFPCNNNNKNNNITWQVALSGLENILRFGAADAAKTSGRNAYAQMVEECSGLDSIESLQSHENVEIYERAYGIIEHYFGQTNEDAADDWQVIPSVPHHTYITAPYSIASCITALYSSIT